MPLHSIDFVKARVNNKDTWCQVVKVNKLSFHIRVNGLSVPMKYSCGWFNDKENVSAGAGEFLRWGEYQKVLEFNEKYNIDYFDI